MDNNIEKAVASGTEQVADEQMHQKFQVSKGDGDVALKLFAGVDELSEPYTEEEERKLKWKLDLLILPLIAVNYCFFYIDKTTLSYAALFNIQTDLHLVGTEYSWLSSLFYFGFLAWAFPTNFLLQKFPVAKYLGVNIFLWGFFLMLQAAATNFASLGALRALAGAAEACADPAFMLITSMWYTRKEQPLRIGLWYTANGFGNSFGGLLGYGIGNIKGSLPSWKYEFLIIGALCCIWGIVMTIFMPDSPVTAKFLTERERRIAVERIKGNQTGIENKHLKPYQIKEAFMDIKLYLLFLIALVGTIPNGGISNFGTLIVKGLGYTTLVTTLLQIPYGVFIAVCILGCVFINDKLHNKRCLILAAFIVPNVVGAFGIKFVPASHKAGRFICYMLTGPYNASFAMLLSLQMANTAGHTKKVVTNAVLFLGYCAGNLSGPFFYKSDQAPGYSLGIWSMIVCHFLEIASALLFWVVMAAENRRRDKLQAQQEGGLDARNLDATAFGDLTDRENLNFRYIY